MKISLTKNKTKYILLSLLALITIVSFIYHPLFSFSHSKWLVLPIVFVFETVLAVLLLFHIEISVKWNQVLHAVFIVFMPLVSLISVELLQGAWFQLTWKAWIVNFFIYLSVYLLFSLPFADFSISVYIAAPLFLLIGMINHYVSIFRGTPMQPWDIAAAKTAMNVVGNFIFSIDEFLLIAVMITCISIALAHILRPLSFTKKKRITVVGVKAATIVLLFCCAALAISGNRAKFDSDLWNQSSSSKKNGYVVNFLLNLQLLNNKAPENYSPETVADILKTYTTDTESERKPNIIVIMNEAFSDLTKLGDIGLKEDYLPFTHSLQGAENSVTGDMMVSVFGGGTCNTEYEFLTSNVCPMLRTGSYPMQQFVNSESVSLASNLRNRGYHTIGIHPYLGSGWNRNRAYPLLGFDEFLTIDDFDDSSEMVRDYISDQSCFEKIKHCTESAEDKPTFVFAVTMQNHGGFADAFANIPDTVSFHNDASFPQLKQYLELAKLSDQALKDLIDYYKNQKRDTIVLMFGDHQPALGDEYKAAFPATEEETIDATVLKYTIPFVMWANFDIEEETVEKISPNYLAPLLLKKSGVGQTAYYKYLSDLRSEIPVISSIACIDSAGDYFDITEDEQKRLLNYRILQYNNVFDKDHLLTDKFYFNTISK